MTPLEYMESQVIKRRLNHDRELARGAPEEQLHNIRLKISYYEAAINALREQADNHVETGGYAKRQENIREEIT